MRIRIKRNVAINENGVVLNPSTGNSFIARPLEQDIIKMLKEGVPITPIKAYILKRYDITKNKLSNDFATLINQLQQYDFIEGNDEWRGEKFNR